MERCCLVLSMEVVVVKESKDEMNGPQKAAARTKDRRKQSSKDTRGQSFYYFFSERCLEQYKQTTQCIDSQLH